MEQNALRQAEKVGAEDAGKLSFGSMGSRPSLLDVLKVRNFRLLFYGEGVSLLGDQFHLIALPWLVLQLTGDPLAMGMVLAVAGVPRALFMLLGGALTDRYAPRVVMLASNLSRMVLVGSLAALVLTGRIEPWMLYGFAFGFGLADAFYFPAQNAIVPGLVPAESLQTANALVQGTAQASVFLGPVLAGAMISVLDGGATPGMTGIGLAFLIDAATFLVSAATLWMIKTGAPRTVQTISESVLSSIRAGLKSVWHDAALRTFFIVVAAINLLVTGPFMVGVPVLADERLMRGATAFGVLMTAFGGGSLVGNALAGALPAPRSFGPLLLVVISSLGVGLAGLGLVHSTGLAAALSLLMGAANGYVVILFLTWLQRRTPPEMLGRMMSLVMFASVGLIPVSTAVSGALVGMNATALFVVAGALMSAITLVAALNPAVRVTEPDDTGEMI